MADTIEFINKDLISLKEEEILDEEIEIIKNIPVTERTTIGNLKREIKDMEEDISRLQSELNDRQAKLDNIIATLKIERK